MPGSIGGVGPRDPARNESRAAALSARRYTRRRRLTKWHCAAPGFTDSGRRRFLPSFLPKGQHGGVEELFPLVTVTRWSGRSGFATSFPSWSRGFDSRYAQRGGCRRGRAGRIPALGLVRQAGGLAALRFSPRRWSGCAWTSSARPKPAASTTGAPACPSRYSPLTEVPRRQPSSRPHCRWRSWCCWRSWHQPNARARHRIGERRRRFDASPQQGQQLASQFL